MRPDYAPPEFKKRRPRWVPPLTAILVCGITALAGSWQLGRAQEKERLRQAYDQGLTKAPVRLTPEPSGAAELRMRRVEVEGRFERSGLALIDNKIRNGMTGYEVVMPLRIDGSSVYVLINRGWVRAGPERAHLPNITTPDSVVKVTGIATVPGRFIELGKTEASGLLWQNLTIDRYTARSGLRVQPVVIQQENEFNDGLLRSWDPPDFGIAKHYAYAVQWFLFSGLTVFLYAYFHVNRFRSKKNPENADSPRNG